jgi:hypothetical protein
VSAPAKRGENWTKIGQSETSPIDNKVRKEVQLDSYYVVIGFEVNRSHAYVDGTHDLAVDYGHAFFYLVKNTLIARVFSFGPNGPGKVGWIDKGGQRWMRNRYNTGAILKDGTTTSRPATPNYAISEPVRAFRILLSFGQAKRLEQEVDKARSQIMNQQIKYNAMFNDTCAETAKEVLDDSGIETPSGYGTVKHSGILQLPLSYSVNPYQWHRDFKASGYKEVQYKPDKPGAWLPPIGTVDPVFGGKTN